jgi:hypothetical protein
MELRVRGEVEEEEAVGGRRKEKEKEECGASEFIKCFYLQRHKCQDFTCLGILISQCVK